MVGHIAELGLSSAMNFAKATAGSGGAQFSNSCQACERNMPKRKEDHGGARR